MTIGKQNIGKIQKGLKNNDISKENIVIEQTSSSTLNSPDPHGKVMLSIQFPPLLSHVSSIKFSPLDR
jgi:hypothetical protein